MGKNKLRKFAEMEQISFVFQYPFAVLSREGFPLKGEWRSRFFHNDNPIVLELGCGKGEYTVELAERFPDKNFIGIDIKGARIWTGATRAEREGLKNVAFLRTNIELLPEFFAAGEVDEIWITFPDPQMKKVRKRLTSSRFLDVYRKVAKPGALIHLKTDSPFLYTYTTALIDLNGITPKVREADLYGGGYDDPILAIKTFYEQQWLSRGKTIKLLKFRLGTSPLEEPDVSDLEPDDYRALPRFNPQEAR